MELIIFSEDVKEVEYLFNRYEIHYSKLFKTFVTYKSNAKNVTLLKKYIKRVFSFGDIFPLSVKQFIRNYRYYG